MTTVPPPITIIHGLDISSFPQFIDPKYTHILNMSLDTNPDASFSHKCSILHIPLFDWDILTPHILHLIIFIDTALQDPENRVLVQCSLGLNRSAAAVTAYLCHVKQISALDALRYLKEGKPDVSPSAVFVKQIDVYFTKYSEDPVDPLVGFHERLKQRKAGLRVDRWQDSQRTLPEKHEEIEVERENELDGAIRTT